MDKVDDILVKKDNENKANYLCCNLKSSYASVECAERNLDPFTTNLVVADPDRSKGTLCLAMILAMKAWKNDSYIFFCRRNKDKN